MRTPRVVSRSLSVLLGVVLAMGVLGAGCTPATERAAANEEEVRAFLEEYLPRLAAAYRQEDPALLEGLAAPKEQAKVDQRVRELAIQGQTLDPDFGRLTLERVEVTWNGTNASVTTVEEWRLALLARGTERLIEESSERTFRVTYHLRRHDDGGWRVLYRTVQE